MIDRDRLNPPSSGLDVPPPNGVTEEMRTRAWQRALHDEDTVLWPMLGIAVAIIVVFLFIVNMFGDTPTYAGRRERRAPGRHHAAARNVTISTAVTLNPASAGFSFEYRSWPASTRVMTSRTGRVGFVKIGTRDVSTWRTVGGIVFLCALVGSLAWWIGVMGAVTN